MLKYEEERKIKKEKEVFGEGSEQKRKREQNCFELNKSMNLIDAIKKFFTFLFCFYFCGKVSSVKRLLISEKSVRSFLLSFSSSFSEFSTFFFFFSFFFCSFVFIFSRLCVFHVRVVWQNHE